MKWNRIVLVILLQGCGIGGGLIWGENDGEKETWERDFSQMEAIPVEKSFDFNQTQHDLQSQIITPAPKEAPISDLELKYAGYFDALPVPVKSGTEKQYPYNVIGRIMGHFHGTGVVYANQRMVLTAGHLFVNLRTGKLYRETPVWYGQINTKESFPDSRSIVGRRIMLHDYGMGYGLINFRKKSDFITMSERVDVALVILYEDGADGRTAAKIKSEESLQLLQSDQPKKSIGYISPTETYGYTISNDGVHPWMMREGKITQQKFEQSPWPYDYLALMKAKPDELKSKHNVHPIMLIGPGMSGSVVWVKDKDDRWQAAGVYVASTSKENVEKYLEHETKTPIVTIAYVLGEDFDTGPFKAAIETLSE